MDNSTVLKETPPGIEVKRILSLLVGGEIDAHGLVPWSSNYTFLVTVDDGSLSCLAIYKPRRGERPLWDFPQGTLCLREYAAYLISEALGWSLVPPTVLRQGPQGLGAVQLFIDAEAEAHYFTFRDEHVQELQRIAAFDCVVNNADRKGGHCLRGKDGRIWAVDHGVTFHAVPKLRTVIWDFAGQPIPEEMLQDLKSLRARLSGRDPLLEALANLLTMEELVALKQRLDRLIETATFPEPDPHRRTTPWPPI
ncbi:MAG: SCO1664 family protein [Anaerolineae bacterium]